MAILCKRGQPVMPDLIGHLSCERCHSPAGADALPRHDGFQPVRVGGKALDGELAQLVPQAGLTSAQTNAVIPFRDRTFPPAPLSLKSEIRRSTPAPTKSYSGKDVEDRSFKSLGYETPLE